MIDLLVIGAGLSGLIAALRAAEQGQRVKVIAKGMGAHHWNAGTIDVLGYLGGEEQPVTSPWAAMARLEDDHPYQLVESDAARARAGLVQEDDGALRPCLHRRDRRAQSAAAVAGRGVAPGLSGAGRTGGRRGRQGSPC